MTVITKWMKIISIVVFLTFSYIGVANAEADNQMVNQMFDEQDQQKKSTKPEEKTDTKAKEDETETAYDSPASFTFSDFFRMGAATAFVLALLYFMLRFMNNKNKAYQKGNIITNLGGTNLGSNKSIQMVKVGEKLYVVGVGDDVRLLSEITDRDEIEQILETYNQKLENRVVPAEKFVNWLKKKQNKEINNDSFTDQLKQQLDEIKNNRKQLREVIEKKVNADDE